jgi:hypothetical protein
MYRSQEATSARPRIDAMHIILAVEITITSFSLIALAPGAAAKIRGILSPSSRRIIPPLSLSSRISPILMGYLVSNQELICNTGANDCIKKALVWCINLE